MWPSDQRPSGVIAGMIAQTLHAVRGAIEQRVLVLPHLDLLTVHQGGLSAEAREVIPLLYENPEIIWLGFAAPSIPLPELIAGAFLYRIRIVGTDQERLRHLVTQAEARKFGRGLDVGVFQAQVGNLNAVRLRRVLASFDAEDYPADPAGALARFRQHVGSLPPIATAVPAAGWLPQQAAHPDSRA
jgi:cell division protease FtsH